MLVKSLLATLCVVCMSVVMAAAPTTDLADAAMAGDIDAVRFLLEQNADINAA